MNRDTLISGISRVAPALSKKDLVPILSCLCFSPNGVLTAYDDIVAMQTKFDLGVVGGIRGQMLIDFLNSTSSKDIEIVAGDKEVSFKSGESKLKAPVLPVDDFVFEVPSIEGSVELGMAPVVIDCFETASVTLGVDPGHAWRLGVTILLDEDKLVFFSSDGFSGTRVELECEGLGAYRGRAVILPPRFCELFIEVGKKDPPKVMNIAKEWVVVEFESGLKLFSRTVGEGEVKNYTESFNESERQGKSQNPQPVPGAFDMALNRSLVVVGTQPDKVVQFVIQKGSMEITAESPYGKSRDVIEFKDHADITVKSHPDLLKACLKEVDKISFSKIGVYMEGPGFIRLVRVLNN